MSSMKKLQNGLQPDLLPCWGRGGVGWGRGCLAPSHKNLFKLSFYSTNLQQITKYCKDIDWMIPTSSQNCRLT